MRVLYVDFDCLRADHIGANGYHRNTSPNIDAIAKRGITFTQCHCANSPCVPSRASLFSGRFGINNGVVGHHGISEQFRPIWNSHWTDPERPTMHWQLWQSGMKTISFSSFADRHNAFWFANGWQELHTFTRKRGMENADVVNEHFLPWFAEHCKEDNWFIHLHYWDIHCPARMPAEFAKRFENDPPPAWPDEEEIERQQSYYGPRTAVDLRPDYDREWPLVPTAIRNRDDFRKLIDGYDGSIAYADHHFGQVLNVLADVGLLDETAIVVSADHGDSFGEHGTYMDHCIANRAVHNIPMVVSWPGMPSGLVCDEMIYGMDLAPTLCDLLGFQMPEKWDGRSFAEAVRGKDFKGWDYQVWDHGIYSFTRTVVSGGWMLLTVMHPGLYPLDQPYYLYNLTEDYYQTSDLAAQRPDKVGELMTKLWEWKQEQLTKGAAPDPMELMVREGPFLYWSPQTMARRLEETGRGDLKADLRQRLARYHGEMYNHILE